MTSREGFGTAISAALVPLFAPARIDGGMWFSDPMANRMALTRRARSELSALDRARALTLGAHRHPELELNVVARGEGTYSSGSQRIPVRSGTILWIPPGVPHVLEPKSGELRLWVMNLRLDVLPKIMSDQSAAVLLGPNAAHLQVRQLALPALRRLGDVFADVLSTRDGQHRLINLRLAYAAAHAYRDTEEGAVTNDLHPAVARAAELIRNAESSLSLEELASRCALSRDRLSRVFAAQMGMSVTEYRSVVRLERFRVLYGRGQRYTLTEAALLAGFGSYAQFQRTFRRQTGKSPADYARSLRGAF